MDKALSIVGQMWLEEAQRLTEMVEHKEEDFKIYLQLARTKMANDIYDELRKVEKYGSQRGIE